MDNKTLVFHKGDVICKAGNYEQWMYEIQSGAVGIYRDYDTPTERKLAVVTDGYIGEMGLIGNICRLATAIAEEETVMTLIDKASYVTYFNNNPEKLTSIMVCLAGRMNRINQDYLEACQTVRDFLKEEENNSQKSSSVAEAMKRFAGIFNFRKSSQLRKK